jgi:RNA polymerase sigma factor (sigma-70 family)
MSTTTDLPVATGRDAPRILTKRCLGTPGTAHPTPPDIAPPSEPGDLPRPARAAGRAAPTIHKRRYAGTTYEPAPADPPATREPDHAVGEAEPSADEVTDAELIDLVRHGNTGAYADLYTRHVAAAHNLAQQLSRNKAEQDDLVAEAFAKVLDVLTQGRGPDSAFRAYLLTAVRHTAYDKTRKDRKVQFAADVSDVSTVRPDGVITPFTDTAIARLERTLAARALARLPERWQAALWHTEIEQQSPADVAPLLGLTPNGVSALAYRAREGLKQAYLQVYLSGRIKVGCRPTTDRLGAWTRDGLSKREKAQVGQHLDECEACQALAAELAELNSACA